MNSISGRKISGFEGDIQQACLSVTALDLWILITISTQNNKALTWLQASTNPGIHVCRKYLPVFLSNDPWSTWLFIQSLWMQNLKNWCWKCQILCSGFKVVLTKIQQIVVCSSCAVEQPTFSLTKVNPFSFKLTFTSLTQPTMIWL